MISEKNCYLICSGILTQIYLKMSRVMGRPDLASRGKKTSKNSVKIVLCFHQGRWTLDILTASQNARENVILKAYIRQYYWSFAYI